MSTIKICSYNVRGINGDTKRRDVLEYLKKMNKNIFIVVYNKLIILKEIGREK
jgi:hypothetical protein